MKWMYCFEAICTRTQQALLTTLAQGFLLEQYPLLKYNSPTSVHAQRPNLHRLTLFELIIWKEKKKSVEKKLNALILANTQALDTNQSSYIV